MEESIAPRLRFSIQVTPMLAFLSHGVVQNQWLDRGNLGRGQRQQSNGRLMPGRAPLRGMAARHSGPRDSETQATRNCPKVSRKYPPAVAKLARAWVRFERPKVW